jgi:acetaldehyde dehydrogenase (acetylating)
MGHTMAIHSQNEQVILEFGLKKPAFRVCVNTPTTFGSIGLTTGLDPAMTLGCGGYGGNITSDNISPRHLLNIKRLAYEIAQVPNRFERGQTGGTRSTSDLQSGIRLPGVPGRPSQSAGIGADVLAERIDRFLGSRGYRAGDSPGAFSPASPQKRNPGATASTPLDFVCEEDVRTAINAGQTLVVSERAIITPAARDLAEQHRVFTIAPWRG